MNRKALPDDLNTFSARYINESDKSLKNVDALKRRILGLSSYFRSAQESLLPRYNKQLGVDYHVVRIPMSDTQFRIYEGARKQERELEKNAQKLKLMNYLKKNLPLIVFSLVYFVIISFLIDQFLNEKRRRKMEKTSKKNKKKRKELLKLLN